MNSDDIFNFEIIPVDKRLEILNSELYSTGRWDNLFYRGQFLQNEIKNIRCIDPCRNCYQSWLNIPFTTFDKMTLINLLKTTICQMKSS